MKNWFQKNKKHLKIALIIALITIVIKVIIEGFADFWHTLNLGAIMAFGYLWLVMYVAKLFGFLSKRDLWTTKLPNIKT